MIPGKIPTKPSKPTTLIVNQPTMSIKDKIKLRKTQEEDNNIEFVSKPNIDFKDSKLNESSVVVKNIDSSMKKSFTKFDFNIPKKLNELNKDNPTIITKSSILDQSLINSSVKDKETRPPSSNNLKEVTAPFKINTKKFDSNITNSSKISSSNQPVLYELGKEDYNPVIHKINDDNTVEKPQVAKVNLKAKLAQNNYKEKEKEKIPIAISTLISRENKYKENPIIKEELKQPNIATTKQESEESDEYDKYEFDEIPDKKSTQNVIETRKPIEQIKSSQIDNSIISKQKEKISNMRKLLDLSVQSFSNIYEYNYESNNEIVKSNLKENITTISNKKYNSKGTNVNMDKEEEIKQEIPLIEKTKLQINLYEPISGDFYKHFIETTPYIESVIQNNINSEILQNIDQNKEKIKTSLKEAFKDFKISSHQLKFFILIANLLNKNIKNTQENFITKINHLEFLEKTTYKCLVSMSLCNNNQSLFNSILLVNLLDSKIEKIFFSFSKINHFGIFGNSEEFIICATEIGEIMIFNLLDSFRDDNYLNISEIGKSNNLKEEEINSLFNNLEKLNIEPAINIDNLFKLHAHKVTLNDNIIKLLIKDKLIFAVMKNQITLIPNIESFKIASEIEINFSNENIYKDNFKNIINSSHNIGGIIDFQLRNLSEGYILTNKLFALIEFSSQETNVYKNIITDDDIRSIYNNITSFSMVSLDLNNNIILTSQTDNTIKVYEENKINGKLISLKQIYLGSSNLDMIKSSISNIFLSQVICKDNKNNSLIRFPCMTNFFALSNKAEFIIFDLNQDKQKLKQPKKVIELIKSKEDRTQLFSILLSQTSYSDYSNILSTIVNIVECIKDEKGNQSTSYIKFHKLFLRDKFFELGKIKKLNLEILNKLN